MNAITAPQHRLVGDFETYYGTDCSLTQMTVPEYIHDPRFELIMGAFKFNEDDVACFVGEGAVRAYLDSLPWDEGIEFVAHNAMFDGAILEWRLGYKPARYFCTMMGSRPFITPFTGRMSLKDVTSYLITQGVDMPPKGTAVDDARNMHLKDFDGPGLKRYMAYCMDDAVSCSAIETWLGERFPEDERDLLNFNIMKFVRSPLLLDVGVLEARLAAVGIMKQELLDRVSMDDRSALMSNPLFAQTLEALGVIPPTKTSPKTGKTGYAFAKTDKAMKELAEHDSLEVQALIAARLGHKSTIEETRLERLRNIYYATGGKLPAALLYYGAHTGRLSGYDKTNLQNLPRGSELRRAVLAPPGYALVAGDLSQIEARIVAWLAGEDDLIQAFAEGRDIYSEFASKAFGYAISKETHPQERFVGKTCILGLGYGMGHIKLQATLANGGVTLTEQKCREIVQLYRRTYPNIKTLWQRAEELLPVIANAADTEPTFKCLGPVTAMPGKIILPNGMAITYVDMEKSSETSSWTAKCGGKPRHLWGGAVTENVVQALARLIIARAEMFLAKRGYPAALQVHDELIYAILLPMVERFTKALTMTLMRQVEWAPGLPIACEVASGANYAEAK